jgi:hypothetical protein
VLTHTDVQYLISLLALVTNSGQIDVGVMIEDVAARKAREVDFTISYTDSNGQVKTLIGVEVKDEKRPLDVEKIGELVNKFGDMPTLTGKAVVSSSGYTEGAVNKAKYHKVDFLNFEPWLKAHQPNVFGITFSQSLDAKADIYHFVTSPNIYLFRVGKDTPETLPIPAKVPLISDTTGTVMTDDLRGVLEKYAIDDFPGKSNMKPSEIVSIERKFNLTDKPSIELNGEIIVWDRAILRGQVTLTRKPMLTSYWMLRQEGSVEPFVACAIFNADEVFDNNIPIDLIGVAVTFNNPPAKLLHIPIDVRLKQKIRNIEAGYRSNPKIASLRQKPDSP